MFSDLSRYIPPEWKYYIKESDLSKVISNLNKHPVNDVLPDKEEIFKAFTLIKPSDVKVIVLGELIPSKEYASGMAYSLKNKSLPKPLQLIRLEKQIRYEFPEMEFTDNPLSQLLSTNALILNNPMTCSLKRKSAHDRYGWTEVIKNIIVRLSYREDSPLVLVAWNKSAYSLYTSIITDWFPSSDHSFYTSPSYSNIYLIVTGPIIEDTIDKDHKRDKYEIIAKRNPFERSNCFRTIKELLVRNPLISP